MTSHKTKIYFYKNIKNISEFKNFENNFLVFSQSDLGKFSQKVYNLLVENFSNTFYVGGMVRDLLLNKKVIDVDIATSATPEQVAALLKNQIKYDTTYKQFGNIVAIFGSFKIEITTFRKDFAGEGRYNKVSFIKNTEQDSNRRDFTMNSLYLSPKYHTIYDYHDGLKHIRQQKIYFIGNPQLRVRQDPLRAVRALRFSLTTKFKLDKKTKQAIKNNFNLINNLTQNKIKKEILKLKNKLSQNILKKVLIDAKLLDKYFK